MKKSKVFTNGIVIGTFLILYFIIMYIATFLVKENFKAEYEEYLFNQAVTLAERMSQDSDHVIEQNKKEKGRELSYLNYMISINNQGMDEYQQISMAVYDTEGNLYTKTGNMFGNNQGMYQIEDYFTEKELEEIICLQPNQEETEEDQSSSGDCYVRMFYCDGYLEPMGVELTRFGNGEVLWNWTNVLTGPDGYSNYDEERTGYIFLPYIDYGRDGWEKWSQDSWLQEYPERETYYSAHMDYFGLSGKNLSMIQSMGIHSDYEDKNGTVQLMFQWGHQEADGFEKNQEEVYTLELRHTIHPWFAAVKYMRYAYLGGFMLIVVCLSVVYYAFKRMLKQQKELENQRRDFVNAAAHELKTPLGIIRGFAENIKENTVEEKKDYYLDQIISQTENMDELVKEMIGISKLDFSEKDRKLESVSFKDIIEGQLEKLKPLIEERNLVVEKQMSPEFRLQGDRALLEKAFWNLLQNAVVHNHSGGWIRVTLTEDFCMIENSGKTIPDNDLIHIKEMFYTGDENRHNRNHKGLGLYLSDRIFEIHGLDLEIGNREDGVMVTVKKNG